MKLSELANLLGGILCAKKDETVHLHISIDSRTIKKNDIFIAMKGKNFDGHMYVKEASKKASVVIVSKKIDDITTPVIVVDDTLEALFKIAKYHKENTFQGLMVAVTGSVGKTTTKEMIAHLLSTTYHVHKSKGNYNNHIGVPLTLLSLKEKHQICVLELGMNHAGEISRLSKLCEPDIALITKIGSAHIGYLGSVKNILKAKLEITDGIKDGVLLLNGNDPLLKNVSSKERYMVLSTCKQTSESEIRKINDTPYTISFELKLEDTWYPFTAPFGGIHLLDNLLLAISIAWLCDVPICEIQKLVTTLPTKEKRLELIKLACENLLIDDTYNASLESVLADIRYLKQFSKKKVVILGDILEVGHHGKTIHKKIGKQLKKEKNIDVFCIGNETKIISQMVAGATHYHTVDDLLQKLEERKYKDAVILVKGSRKMGLETVAITLKEKYQKEK